MDRMGKTAEILKIGLPIMLGQACVVILSFADNIMIGWYGVNDLAASSFVNGVINLFIIMEMGFANGMTPVIGSQYGVGDRAGIGMTLKNSIVLNGIVAMAGLVIMAVIYAFLDRFGQEEQLLPLIRPYYIVVAVSTLFAMGFNTLKQFTDGTCQPIVSMSLLMGGNLLNIAGNWVLIYGKAGFPELGLLGAGISTLASRIIMFSVFLIYIMRSPRFREYASAFRSARISWTNIRRLFNLPWNLFHKAGKNKHRNRNSKRYIGSDQRPNTVIKTCSLGHLKHRNQCNVYWNRHTCNNSCINRIRQLELESCQRIRSAGGNKQKQNQGNCKHDHTVHKIFSKSACKHFLIIRKIQALGKFKDTHCKHFKLLFKRV